MRIEDPFKTFKGENAEEYFKRILGSAPKAQIYLQEHDGVRYLFL